MRLLNLRINFLFIADFSERRNNTKKTYQGEDKKSLADYFSTIKIILKFLSLKSLSPLN